MSDNYTLLMRELNSTNCVHYDDAEPVMRLFAKHRVGTDRSFLVGARELLKRWRKANPDPVEERERIERNIKIDLECGEQLAKRLNVILAPVFENERKAQQYDKIVQLLDTWMVGDTKLGDCTKTKLLSESAKMEQASAQAARHAVLYKKLAATLGNRETIRTTANRKTVLDVLLESIDGVEAAKVAA